MTGMRKIRIGRVLSNKMNKTVVVAVEVPKRHPLYKKVVNEVVKYKAHDEKSESKPGDVVKIEETRPLSKEKRWQVAEIVTRAAIIEVRPEEIAVPELKQEAPVEQAAPEATATEQPTT